MDDRNRLPDARLHQMMSAWPQYEVTKLERLTDELKPVVPVSAARMWMAQCRSMLPVDQNITSDYRVLCLLERAALETIHVGINGRRWLFADGSTIVANNQGDKVYAP